MGKTELYIYGASGHGRVVYDVASRLGYNIKGFIDDDKNKRELLNLPVLPLEKLYKKSFQIALGIGDNKNRCNRHS
jgi:hypothetical protein